MEERIKELMLLKKEISTMIDNRRPRGDPPPRRD